MFSIIRLDEYKKWDEVVKSFEKYDVQYLNGYAKAFQFNDDGEPILFYYNYSGTRGINVIFRRDIADFKKFKGILPKNKYFDISTPYGYGGFIVEGDDFQKLNYTYNEYCIENGIISEFVRFNLFNSYRNYYDGKIEMRMHNIVRSLYSSIDDIYMDFEHKVRKNLKKANKNSLKIIIDDLGEKVDDFLKIYYMTMNRTSSDSSYYFPKQFFDAINAMKNNFIYFFTMLENEVISAELILYGKENCYSFLGGTNDQYFNYRPNEFLKFEIIKWSKNKGINNFVLGGGYGTDDGIYKYKKSLAPNGIVDFYTGEKIFNDSLYKKLVDIRLQKEGTILNTKYFPLYRG